MFPISPILYKVLGILALVLTVVLTTIHYTSEYKDGQYAKEKLKQAEIYKEAVNQVRTTELQIANLQTQLEGTYEKENARVNEVLLHYTGLINDGFRLRDKNRTASRSVSTDSASGATYGGNQPTCSNELSTEATRFLLGISTEADKVVNQLVTCQKYATELRNACSATTP